MRANHFLVRHIDSIVYLCVFASILFRAASSSRQFARGLGWWTVLGGTAMNIHEHSHLATEGELAGLLIVSPGLLPLRNIHCNFFSFDFYEYFYESEGRYFKKIICVRFQSKVLSVYKYI